MIRKPVDVIPLITRLQAEAALLSNNDREELRRLSINISRLAGTIIHYVTADLITELQSSSMPQHGFGTLHPPKQCTIDDL